MDLIRDSPRKAGRGHDLSALAKVEALVREERDAARLRGDHHAIFLTPFPFMWRIPIGTINDRAK